MAGGPSLSSEAKSNVLKSSGLVFAWQWLQRTPSALAKDRIVCTS
jgi:hypothetical protein